MNILLDKEDSRPFWYARDVQLVIITRLPLLGKGRLLENETTSTYKDRSRNFLWCGGWDSNPRRPSPQGPKPRAGAIEPTAHLTWLWYPRAGKEPGGNWLDKA